MKFNILWIKLTKYEKEFKYKIKCGVYDDGLRIILGQLSKEIFEKMAGKVS